MPSNRTKLRLFVTAVTLIVAGQSNAEESLCAPRALLKEDALRLRAEEARFSKQPESPAAKTAAKSFEDAKTKFCAFVAESMYVD